MCITRKLLPIHLHYCVCHILEVTSDNVQCVVKMAESLDTILC